MERLKYWKIFTSICWVRVTLTLTLTLTLTYPNSTYSKEKVKNTLDKYVRPVENVNLKTPAKVPKVEFSDDLTKEEFFDEDLFEFIQAIKQVDIKPPLKEEDPDDPLVKHLKALTLTTQFLVEKYKTLASKVSSKVGVNGVVNDITELSSALVFINNQIGTSITSQYPDLWGAVAKLSSTQVPYT